MCARRFLGFVFVLTLLFVAGAFAIYQWGGSVLLKQATPRGHFQAAQAGSGPDYRDPASWIARPGLADDPSRWRPEGMPADSTPESVATFYVHPTTYLATDRWNAPLQPGGDTEFRTRLFVQSQASTVELGQVWAPRYRQAAYGAFLLKSADAGKALDLAYSDVAAAFDEFLREAPSGPIILAGHSQGALHLMRLLKEKVAGKPVARRIVAAYVAGWPISTTADLPALGLPACSEPAQAGCVLSWLSFRDPANPGLIFGQWEKTTGFNGGDRRQEDVLCTNPVTGTENGGSDRAVPGILTPTADLRSATISDAAISARCRNGLLIVDGEIPPLGPYVLPGNNYHVYDYALFWGAIRRDAIRRAAAWH